ncbi:MAG: NAD(P)H-hydrate dehydratase [Phototrophicales bacterium]|nr:MAG: NAD(P)H-hydrate dehydratase [Phototrophicales bacterium]
MKASSMTIKLVSVAEMRSIEAEADAVGHSYAQMMQFAGRAAAELLIDLKWGAKFLILIGPGNNGGDGLVVARYLMTHVDTAQVTCYLLKERDDQVYQDAVVAGAQVILAADDSDFAQLRKIAQQCDVVVDALLGTGTQLPLRSQVQSILKVIHEIQQLPPQPYHVLYGLKPTHESSVPSFRVFAIDCPSGVDCDTGAVDPYTLRADCTITFAAVKKGLLAFPAYEYLGQLVVGDIGLPSSLPTLDGISIEIATIEGRLPARPSNSHKGTFGKVLIVAGSGEYIGAAYLSASAAYRIGAGLVTVGAPDNIIPTLAAMLPEATWFPLPRVITEVDSLVEKVQSGYNSLLIGPGLGQASNTQQFLSSFLDTESDVALPHMVIDADGLNLLAKIDDWAQRIRPNTILTPHPAEFSRLTGLSVEKIQEDRLTHAINFAQKWNVIIVLKGAFTVIATPEGKAWISPYANSVLATAGTGDVLAGCIAGLLAQGLSPVDSAIAGVCIHGKAAEFFPYQGGMLANELLDKLPLARM